MALVMVIPTAETLAGPAGAARVFLPNTMGQMLDWAKDKAQSILEQYAQSFGKDKIVVSTEVRRGDTATQLIEAIAAHRVDLVVMATHVRIGLEGIWSGSVTPRVVDGSSCPVLLVPIRDAGTYHV
jgi:nucleotide-binding universal stress UspA family protein